MNPVRGESAPDASMSRSATSRGVSVTVSSESRSSDRGPLRSTSSPPCGAIRCCSVATLIARGPLPGWGPPTDPAQSVAEDVSRVCHEVWKVRAGSSRADTALHQAQGLEALDDVARAPLGGLRLRVHGDLRVRRLLVGVVDAREALDLAGERLRVQAVDVALRARVDRCLHVNLDEVAELLHHRARLAARLLVRRDRRADHRPSLTRQTRRDPADPLDVRVAVLLGESETLGEARANGVAVQVLHDRAPLVELGPDEVRDRRLARARKPREPEREPTLALVRGLRVLVGVDVFRHAVLSVVPSRWM